VSGESDTVEPVKVLPADSAANLTAQDRSLQNISSSVKQDVHNSSSLSGTATSVTPLSSNKTSLFTLDAGKDSPANLNLPSQSPDHNKDLNRTDHIIQVVLVILVALLVVVFAVLFFKRSSNPWRVTHHRHTSNEQMDILLDEIYVPG
jgi:hypothetical protein